MSDIDGVDQGDEQEPKEKKSAATLLVEIAQERYAFGVSTDGDTFGVPHEDPRVVLMLRGGKTSLRGQLARTYFARTGRAAPQSALADALLVIEGMAQEADPVRLYLRSARHGDTLWLDLGDQTGCAVMVTAAGWHVVDRPPVLFKRTALNGALPGPVVGGDLDELWSWLNVGKEDRPLVAAWLVSVLFPDIPHPVLGLFGEQGTGKTTAEKMLVSVLDPGPVPARKPPKDADAWVTAATGSWVVGLDNLSDISPWLSDSLCRAVTGDGDVRRKLYTDGDLAVFAFRRCVVINGIDVGEMRGDLAERMLPVDLDMIGEEERREEQELWPAWSEAHPRVLGAMLDLAADVLAKLPGVELTARPRMADFARILSAVDQVLGTAGFNRYLSRQGVLAVDSLTADEFVIAVAKHFPAPVGFTGSSAELLHKVTPTDEKWRAPRGWPDTARKVTTRLKRQAPVMRKAGWQVHDDGGENHSKSVHWTLVPPTPEEMGTDPDPRHPHYPQTDPQAMESAGVAGVAGTDPYPSLLDTLPESASRRVRVTKGIVPTGAVYVGRPAPRVRLAGSPYGNPHPVGRPLRDGDRPCKVSRCKGAVHDRAEAIDAFREDLRADPAMVEAIRRDFADGQAAACFCPLDLACHADVIIAVAEGANP